MNISIKHGHEQSGVEGLGWGGKGAWKEGARRGQWGKAGNISNTFNNNDFLIKKIIISGITRAIPLITLFIYQNDKRIVHPYYKGKC